MTNPDNENQKIGIILDFFKAFDPVFIFMLISNIKINIGSKALLECLNQSE